MARLILDEKLGLERVAIVGMWRLEKSGLAGKPDLAGFPVEAIGDDGDGAAPGPGALRTQRRHR